MSVDEYIQKMKLLEAENQALRQKLLRLENNGTKDRLEWADEMEAIVPRRSHLGFVVKSHISGHIRKLCFRPFAQLWNVPGEGKKEPRDRVLKTSEMTDEEYAKYVRIMCAILKILKENAYKESDYEWIPPITG